MDFLLGLAVQVAGRFVGKEDRRIVHQGAGNGHTLLLAAGKFGRFVGETLRQPDLREQATGLFLRLPRRDAGDEGGNHHVLQGVEFRQQVMCLEHEADPAVPEGGKLARTQMKDIGPVHPEGARVRRGQGSQDLKEGGFSCAGGAHDGHDLGPVHFQIHPFEHFQRAETLFDTLCFDNHDAKIRKNRRSRCGNRKKCAIFAVRNLEKVA